MRVVYSDESGTGGKDYEPVTVITALMMNMDEHWPRIESALAQIKADTPSVLLDDKTGELKGSHLYSAMRKAERSHAFGQQIDPNLEKARDILLRLLAVPEDYSIPIFYGAVDRLGYDTTIAPARAQQELQESKARQLGKPIKHFEFETPHDIAFDDCFARVDNVAHAELRKNEQILWIHDHRSGDREEQRTKGAHFSTRFKKQMGFNAATQEYVGLEHQPSDVRIIEPIYFGHSHESLALQLADVCCSTIALKILERWYPQVLAVRGWQPLVEPFYKIIRRGVMNDGTEPAYRDGTEKQRGAAPR